MNRVKPTGPSPVAPDAKRGVRYRPGRVERPVRCQSGRHGQTGGHLDFVYAACRVTIDNGEYSTLEPIGDVFDPDRVDA